MNRYPRHLHAALGVAAMLFFAAPAQATYHMWQIEQIYSNATGTVQFIQLSTGTGGQQFVTGQRLVVQQAGMGSDGYGYPMPGPSHSYSFASNLPGDTTNRHFLIATQGFANLGTVAPDYIVPNGFLFQTDATLSYAGTDNVMYGSLPTDGVHSIDRMGNSMVAMATNFAGKSGAPVAAAPAGVSVSLENPQPASFQSGIGLLSGWACQGPTMGIAIDGGTPLGAPYGSARADTASVCGEGNTNTGFGLLFNFNTLSPGSHSAQLFVNGQAQGNPTQFTVTVPAGEFLTGVSKQVTVSDFPTPGKTTTLIWQQSQQNYAIKAVGP